MDDSAAVHKDDRIERCLDDGAGAQFAAAKRLHVLPPFGQVAHDFAKAAQLAVVVADGGDDGIGPIARAVAASAPAILLEATLADGGPQHVLNFLLRHVARKEFK